MAKTSIGGLVFDAVLKTDHTSKVTATSHPVESGANISDHAFVEPAEISLEVGVSDCDDYTTMFAFKANIMLKEVPIVSTSRVSVTSRASVTGSDQSQKAGSTNSGTTQATTPKQSVIKQATALLKGA